MSNEVVEHGPPFCANEKQDDKKCSTICGFAISAAGKVFACFVYFAVKDLAPLRPLRPLREAISCVLFKIKNLEQIQTNHPFRIVACIMQDWPLLKGFRAISEKIFPIDGATILRENVFLNL